MASTQSQQMQSLLVDILQQSIQGAQGIQGAQDKEGIVLGTQGTQGIAQGTIHDKEAYLQLLLNTPLQSLLNEPQTLQNTLDSLKARQSLLAFSDYSSFLLCAECANQFQTSFSQILTALQTSTPKALSDFEAKCKDFTNHVPSILNQITHDKTMQDTISDVLTILEIPHLIDVLAKSAQFDQVMDLLSHVNKLCQRHPDIAVLKLVAAQVQQSTRSLKRHLITQLQQSPKLPAAIRIIGFLRRLDVCSESELRVLFLKQRDRAVSSTLRSLEGIPSTEEYLKKYIEVTREHLFESGTQYKAIFGDDFMFSSSINANETDIYSILPSYITKFIQSLHQVVSEQLQHIHDVSILSNLLTSVQYLGLSLSRVGIDVRDMFVPLFIQRCSDIVVSIIQTGIDQVVSQIRLSKNDTMVSSTSSSNPTLSLSSTKSKAIQAPTSLLSVPLLASTLNTFFHAYNQLRLIPAFELYTPLSDVIYDSVRKVVMELLKFKPREGDSNDTWNKIQNVLWNDCVSSIVDGFESIFGVGDKLRVKIDTMKKELGVVVWIETVASSVVTPNDVSDVKGDVDGGKTKEGDTENHVSAVEDTGEDVDSRIANVDP